MHDVIIIGAGVIGCAIARELSRYRLRIAVLEKEADVGLATSCRNSGVVHSGINYAPGTLRAALSVRGNAMMDELCRSLKVPLRRIGKLTVALAADDLPGLHRQREYGLANGVPGMELLDNAAMRRIQPGIAGILGLWTPSSAIVSPYGLTIALAENAQANGVDFHLGHAVSAIARKADGDFSITAGISARPDCGRIEGEARFSARVVINAAGLHADAVGRLVGVDAGRIWPCRGEYHVLDKRLAGALRTLVYPVPGPSDPGLGIHLTPTVDGNILVGPSAEYLDGEPGDRDDYRTTRAVMERLARDGAKLLPGLSVADFITSFAGNRPKLTPPEVGGNADFHIDDTRVPGFVHLCGIESPGLTSSPAIAVMVREMVARRLELREREDFVGERPGFAGRFHDLPLERRMDMIADDREYGEVVCRCERITRREVRDAFANPLRARTLLAIKYRSRAMMGRCQGGFCLPRIVALLADEYGCRPEDFLLRGGDSPLFSGPVRA